MNWKAVRCHNAAASVRKAKRERVKAELDRRIEQAGGPFKAAEIRSAPTRWDDPAPGRCRRFLVMSIRGLDWTPWSIDGVEWNYLVLFRDGRQSSEGYMPVTPGARTALRQVITQAFGATR